MHLPLRLELLPLYGLIALNLGLCLILFVTAKREIRRSQVKNKEQKILLQEAYDRLELGFEQLGKRVEDLDERAGGLVPPASAKSGMNLNKRVQAAHMFRRGERPEQIAAALSLPRNEVALLLKVQQTRLPG
jgi:hypothetical protein